MRVIDLEDWPRRDHFLLFRTMPFPNVNLSIQVDITDLWKRRRHVGPSPTISLTYVLARAANRIPEFRQRIRGDQVIEHDLIHPQIAVLGPDDLFGVCSLRYDPDFLRFAEDAAQRITASKNVTSLDAFPHVERAKEPRDDLLSITTLPWLTMTGFGITRPKTDSIPLIAYGRITEEAATSVLTLHLNFHHGLIDGVHVAKLARHVEEEAAHLAARSLRGDCG